MQCVFRHMPAVCPTSGWDLRSIGCLNVRVMVVSLGYRVWLRKGLAAWAGRRDFPWQRSAVVYVSSGPMQTVAGVWRLYSHTFQGYGQGVRRALLILRGRDDQFWAGAQGGVTFQTIFGA